MEREPERDLEEMQEQADRLAERTEAARDEWDEKKADSGVPGALEDVAEMDAGDAPETDYPSKS
jgi:hypothetical protein